MDTVLCLNVQKKFSFHIVKNNRLEKYLCVFFFLVATKEAPLPFLGHSSNSYFVVFQYC